MKQETTNLVTLTEEILKGTLIFLCSCALMLLCHATLAYSAVIWFKIRDSSIMRDKKQTSK